jgi:hypothetical protein
MRFVFAVTLGILSLSCGKHDTSSSGGGGTPLGSPGNPGAPVQPVAAPYVLPADVTIDVAAERGAGGEIVLVGSTNLPDGTKLGAEVPLGKGQDYSIFVAGGRFKSEGFSDGGRPLAAGPHKILMLTYFNGAWQTPQILGVVGKLNYPLI